jgi:excisionase family DNA binding protein
VCRAGASDTSPNYADSMSPERRPPDVDDEFLTVAEVAAVLKLNQQTIRNWIDAGSLAALRVGRRVRVLRRDLDQLLADAAQPSRVEQRTATDEPRHGRRVARRSTVLGRPVGLRSTTLDNSCYVELPANGLVCGRPTAS